MIIIFMWDGKSPVGVKARREAGDCHSGQVGRGLDMTPVGVSWYTLLDTSNYWQEDSKSHMVQTKQVHLQGQEEGRR